MTSSSAPMGDPAGAALELWPAPPTRPSSPGLLTLSPLLRSFQKGWMKSQEPSLPVASSVTRMAFFSSRAGSRLFTVRYLLLFMCRSWGRGAGEGAGAEGGQPSGEGALGGRQGAGEGTGPHNASPAGKGALGSPLDLGHSWTHMQCQIHRHKHTN